MGYQYNYRGGSLLHPHNIEMTPGERLVTALLMGNSRALEFCGHLDALPPAISTQAPRKCDKCKEMRPPWEYEHERAWLCLYCQPPRAGVELPISLADTHKWCSRCLHWHPKTDFSPKRDARDKLHPYCKRHRNGARRAAYREAKRGAFATRM